jgi:hypothetical protein
MRDIPGSEAAWFRAHSRAGMLYDGNRGLFGHCPRCCLAPTLQNLAYAHFTGGDILSEQS